MQAVGSSWASERIAALDLGISETIMRTRGRVQLSRSRNANDKNKVILTELSISISSVLVILYSCFRVPYL